MRLPSPRSLSPALLCTVLFVMAQTPAGAARAPASRPLAARPVRSRPGQLPGAAQLMAMRARIGRIEIIAKPIFDLSKPQNDNWLFRTADLLHLRTRPSAVRAQLLFHSGELYSPALLRESARNIRHNLSFVREPVIRPIAYHDGLVDVAVLTHDVWTLQPGLTFSRAGGVNTTSVDFSYDNFLGFGKYIAFGHGRNVDRTYTYGAWSDPNVWGSHFTDSLNFSANSDGDVWSAAVSRPFYSLETRYAGGALLSADRGIVTRYVLGHPYDAYRSDEHSADARIGEALTVTTRWTVRVQLGFRHDESVFAPTPRRALLAPLPADRNLAYPYVRAHWIRNHYVTMRNLRQIGFTEDVHLGLDLAAGIGWSAPVFGADRRALIGDMDVRYGWQLGAGQELFGSGHFGGRYQNGQLRDGLLLASASYYLTTSADTKAVVRVSAGAGLNPDGDHFFELGGDSGLRGYPLRYQTGRERALLTVEERLYTPLFLLQLVHVGAAAYFDMGRTWGHSLVPVPQLGLLRDVGIGLRLGNARSSFGNVIHIDLATPLDGHGIRRLQFLVSTEQSY